jgi:hypothetical protein
VLQAEGRATQRRSHPLISRAAFTTAEGLQGVLQAEARGTHRQINRARETAATACAIASAIALPLAMHAAARARPRESPRAQIQTRGARGGRVRHPMAPTDGLTGDRAKPHQARRSAAPCPRLSGGPALTRTGKASRPRV